VACHKPSSELLGRLKAGFKDESVQFVAPQVVKYKDQSVVVLLYKTTSGVTTGTFDAFFIDHGTIYEVHSAARAPESPTTFPAPPKADLIASDGLRRGLECLQKGLPRPTRP
jgi:hypothetical protein